MTPLRILFAAALLTLPAEANAHDTWRNGDPIPAWVKGQCCGTSDAHHLEPGQIHETDQGYEVEGYPNPIPRGKLLPSPDGDWWVFYRMYPDRSYSPVYCFFGPLGT